MANGNNEVTGWVGWVYFAGLLMVITGILQIISGMTALLNDKFFIAHQGALVVFDYTTWGWIELVLGIIVVSAGSAVMNGHAWGRVVGVFLAILAVLANFLLIPVYPFWAIISMVVGVLVIYALTVHGHEVRGDM